MALTMTQARQILRVDEGPNDDLIQALVTAIPSYIETATGLTEAEQDQEPMVYTASSLLLQLWYFSEHSDDQKLSRCINSLLFAISLKGRGTAQVAAAGNG